MSDLIAETLARQAEFIAHPSLEDYFANRIGG